MVDDERIKEIKQIYRTIRDKIISRMNDFREVLNKDDDRIFAELIFCLLTPQSNAKICWNAVENVVRKGLLLNGSREQILKEIGGVRFKYKKADYILLARKQFMDDGRLNIKDKVKGFVNIEDARDWLVNNIKGMGYKEASHFLRNIGLGEELAILDRHILKNLKLLGVIRDVPNHLSKKNYFEIEKRFEELAKRINIPMSHLDLVLWYKETKEVFK